LKAEQEAEDARATLEKEREVSKRIFQKLASEKEEESARLRKLEAEKEKVGGGLRRAPVRECKRKRVDQQHRPLTVRVFLAY